MREIRTLRLTWRGLETWPRWNCEPIPQSKERNWKPSTYSRRACPRPYLKTSGRVAPPAEFNRSIRPGVLWRKGSAGTQSAAGSRFVESLLTVVSTLKQQQRNILAYLTTACEAALHGAAAPSLLPASAQKAQAAA